jgi:hypothetical protein
MKPEYKNILHAMQTLDKARWDLGDALVAECGAPDPTSASYEGPGKLRAAWHTIRENGYECCTLEDLSKLRRVAYVFKQSTRRSDISWDLHVESGTPEMLQAIMAGIPKGTAPTKSYIASVRKQRSRASAQDGDLKASGKGSGNKS